MFSICIQQDVLMSALNYLEPTVGKNISGFSDNCISIKSNGLGGAELYTTNTIEFTMVEAILSSAGNIPEQCPLVDFKRFKTIISSIPSSEIITIEENTFGELIIKFSLKKTPVVLATSPGAAIPLPTNAFPASGIITIPKASIKMATDNASTIIHEGGPNPIYTCVRIYTTGNQVEVTALDMMGKRTFVQNFTATNNNRTGDVLVEANKLKRSMKIFENWNELEFNMDANMIMITGVDPISTSSQKTGGMIPSVSYYCRRLTGQFPGNIAANLIPMPTEFIEINSQDMKECLMRVKAIEDSASLGTIGFDCTGNNIVITCNSAYGNIEDEIPIERATTQAFKTSFRHQQLNEIIKTLNSENFMIGALPNHPSNFVIKASGDDDTLFTIPAIANPTLPSTATP